MEYFQFSPVMWIHRGFNTRPNYTILALWAYISTNTAVQFGSDMRVPCAKVLCFQLTYIYYNFRHLSIARGSISYMHCIVFPGGKPTIDIHITAPLYHIFHGNAQEFASKSTTTQYRAVTHNTMTMLLLYEIRWCINNALQPSHIYINTFQRNE